ncbi:MAG: ATP-binding cassette domain-containing protein [Candidatus Accumulibacter sp.]|uniref:ATP-binding cassette domain-containing protein n=2 Tax=Candidatus Accumulibacter TaxID=327159 RepID=A0A935Q2L4_9PROT|nr:ATP-binding cassette domain-containing protein [Candidatus Accumulibacter proximus]MBL8376192.1 ATP-binding cassette domain-containing protein [Accumulibacter sp.]
MGSLARLRIDQFVTRHVGPIELSIGAAECVCIEGPSGSGKTLLLRAIADLDPHRGEAYLDGASCSSLPAPAWRHSVALVVAESQWWSERIGDHFDRGVDEAWLEQLGLPDSAMNWEVARCSTGERQRLALLRTLMQAPAALLLDEPTGNLDQESTRRVESLLAGYQRQWQAALLWVSHDAGQIERVSQRSFILNDGRLAEKLPR